MGKRRFSREVEEETDDMRSPPRRKHKHKHKKHKRRREVHTTSTEEASEHKGREVKLKIKLGGQTLTTTHAQVREYTVSDEDDVDSYHTADSFTIDNIDSEEGSEEINVENAENSNSEDEWLAALENGDLDENGRLRTAKDTSMMTARQRAMLGDSQYVEPLLELPMGRKQTKEVTEEMLQRKRQRATKRKLQMAKQIEKDKAQTIDKLLYKQASRSRKDASKKRLGNKDKPKIRYINRVNYYSLSFPENSEFSMVEQVAKPPKERQLCAVDGCKNYRRYADSKLNVPLCSLECYKKLHNTKNVVANVSS